MIFYHGTTRLAWEKIQKEGVLWGIRSNHPNRSTSLASRKDIAGQFGDYILEVEYEPGTSDDCGPFDDYKTGCWQFRTFKPIPIENIKKC